MCAFTSVGSEVFERAFSALQFLSCWTAINHSVRLRTRTNLHTLQIVERIIRGTHTHTKPTPLRMSIFKLHELFVTFLRRLFRSAASFHPSPSKRFAKSVCNRYACYAVVVCVLSNGRNDVVMHMSQAEREPWCRNKNKRTNDWKPSENKSSAMKLEENGNDDIT